MKAARTRLLKAIVQDFHAFDIEPLLQLPGVLRELSQGLKESKKEAIQKRKDLQEQIECVASQRLKWASGSLKEGAKADEAIPRLIRNLISLT